MKVSLIAARLSGFSGQNYSLGRTLVKINHRIVLILALVSLVAVGSRVASAQAADVYKVNYFSNNFPVSPGIATPLAVLGPDGTVRISNPGLTYGNLCAMIYVFDQDQQMAECCGCVETHNGLRTLSVRSNLMSNPLTGVISNNGVIKVVSAAVNNSPCDPSANVAPKPNLRVWVTHLQNPVGGAFPITETESSDSTLGATELANLQAQCSFIHILGSGQGICSCGTGD